MTPYHDLGSETQFFFWSSSTPGYASAYNPLSATSSPSSSLGTNRRVSTGILTCLPSTTPFGLVLGPDSPFHGRTYVKEPLGLSGHWILTNVCVTQADILTSAPSTPTVYTRRFTLERNAPPTDTCISFKLIRCIPRLRQTA